MMIRKYHLIMVAEMLLLVRGETLETPKTTTIGNYTLEYFSNGKTASNAKATCESRNAWLIEVKDEEIGKAIEPWLSHYVLIGGKYDNGAWKWNDGSLMRYTNWANGAPYSDPSKKCLLIKDKTYLWKNENCGLNKVRYICQSDRSYPGGFQINVVKTSVKFAEAKTYCSNNGSRLVEIKTSALDSFINNIINGDSRSYWTSGQYSGGSWKWGDGNSISTSYSNWASPEPIGTNNFCLMKAQSIWKSATCSEENGYICQKNLTSGSCKDEVCSNRGKCSIVNQRYKCSCNAGYFGTKCEKNMITISTATKSYNIQRGQTIKITFEILSYDGNVEVKDINKNKVIKSTSGITSSSLTDSFDFTPGPFNITTSSINYVFEATSENSGSTSLTLNINVKDHCDSNPCANGASCNYLTSMPYFTCTCLPAYKGNTCDERVFVENDDCKYHVNNEPKVTFTEANSTCHDLGGSLAMMKTNTLQDFVEKQIAEQYGENNPPVIALWIGGIKRLNSWYWLDDTSISLTGDHAQWSWDTQYKANKTYVVLSSYDETRTSMIWFSKKKDEKFGFVCEIAKTKFCASFLCENGGTCITVGCQRNCQCRPGYIGVQCEYKIFTIVSTIYNFISIVDQNINVTLNVLGYNDSVRVDVFQNSFTLSPIKTINNIIRTTNVVIGPFLNQSIGTTYYFRATPETAQGIFYKNTSIKVVVQGPSQIQNIAPKILAIPDVSNNSVINCNATGVPMPTVYWYKDNILITNNNSSGIHQKYKPGYASLFVENHVKLNFGNYTCHAFNIINGEKKTSNDTALLRAAGVPILFENIVEECSSNITISWTPALEAIGIQHRIDVIKFGMNSTKIYSEIITPNTQYKKVKKITNLEYLTSYKISITICPEMCRYPATTTKSITTHAGIPGPVSTANVTQSNKTCVIRWSMHSITGITGFTIKAVSTLLHYDSESYPGNNFFEERKVVTDTRYLDFDYTFNRNYTFSIQAQTCAGSGPSLDVTGNCVTDTGHYLMITPESTKYTAIVGKYLTIMLDIQNYDGLVKVDVFANSINSTSIITVNYVNETAAITIGPFTKIKATAKFYFRASPQMYPESYNRWTSITVVVQETATTTTEEFSQQTQSFTLAIILVSIYGLLSTSINVILFVRKRKKTDGKTKTELSPSGAMSYSGKDKIESPYSYDNDESHNNIFQTSSLESPANEEHQYESHPTNNKDQDSLYETVKPSTVENDKEKEFRAYEDIK